jgi:hypothetical protein
MTEKPWDINPDLEKDRINTLAQFIAEVRGEVIDLDNEEIGDTKLSLGVRCYECCRTRLIRLADSGQCDWLANLTKKGMFTFLVGKTPVRFVRCSPNSLPSKKLIRSNSAAIQLCLFSFRPEYKKTSDVIWYIVFDTKCNHPADRIYFVGYRRNKDKGKEIVCNYQISLEGKKGLLFEVNAPELQPVEVAEAPLSLKVKHKKAAGSENE